MLAETDAGFATDALDALPRASGPSLGRAVIRSRLSDFVVDEILSFTPCGDGEHQFIHVEKRGIDTHRAAAMLAAHAGVRSRDVGYAGRKDRHAITRQWFSIGQGGRTDPDWSTLEGECLRVLDVTRNDRKLRRGAIAHNRFQIVLREAEDIDGAIERLGRLALTGAPNYFGPQRFGRNGSNLARARALFGGATLRRNTRSMAMSAARSLLFNELLARRVSDGTWNTLQPGDVASLDGTRSVFTVSVVDPALEERVHALDVHPSGPLWGSGDSGTQGAVRTVEDSVAAHYAGYADGLVACGVKSARRALRLTIRDLKWERDGEALVLSFGLVSGSYATTVIRELYDIVDAAATAAR